jgi:hypothetical protein
VTIRLYEAREKHLHSSVRFESSLYINRRYSLLESERRAYGDRQNQRVVTSEVETRESNRMSRFTDADSVAYINCYGPGVGRQVVERFLRHGQITPNTEPNISV